ncbi:hypothetical protein RI367_007989 [Sorochytrium milnesiophthora]
MDSPASSIGRADASAIKSAFAGANKRFSFLSVDPTNAAAADGPTSPPSILSMLQNLPPELSPAVLAEKFPQLRNIKAFRRLLSLSSSAAKRQSVLALPDNLVSNRQAFFEQEVLRELSELENSKDWFDVQRYIESYLNVQPTPESSTAGTTRSASPMHDMSAPSTDTATATADDVDRAATRKSHDQFTEILLNCEESLSDLTSTLTDSTLDNMLADFLSSVIANVQTLVLAPQAAHINISDLSQIKGALADMRQLLDTMAAASAQHTRQHMDAWKSQVMEFVMIVEQSALEPVRGFHMQEAASVLSSAAASPAQPEPLDANSELRAEWLQFQATLLAECCRYMSKHTALGQRSKWPSPLPPPPDTNTGPDDTYSMHRRDSVQSFSSSLSIPLPQPHGPPQPFQLDTTLPLSAYSQSLLEFGRYLTHGTLVCHLYNELICEKYPQRLEEMGVVEERQRPQPASIRSSSAQRMLNSAVSATAATKKKGSTVTNFRQYEKILGVMQDYNATGQLHEKIDLWIKFTSMCHQALNIDWNDPRVTPFGCDPVEIAMCSDTGRQQAQMALIVFMQHAGEVLCLETPPVSKQDVERLLGIHQQLHPNSTNRLPPMVSSAEEGEDVLSHRYMMAQPLSRNKDVVLAMTAPQPSTTSSAVVVQRIDLPKQHVLSLRTKLDPVRETQPPPPQRGQSGENSLRRTANRRAPRIGLGATAQWYLRRLKRILVMLDAHRHGNIVAASSYWPSTLLHTSFRLSSAHILGVAELDDSSDEQQPPLSGRRRSDTPMISPLMNLLLTAPALYFELPVSQSSQVCSLSAYLSQYHSFSHAPNPKNAREWVIHRDQAYSTNRAMLKIFKDVAAALMYLHEEWNLAHGLLSADSILVLPTPPTPSLSSPPPPSSADKCTPTAVLCVPSMTLTPPKSYLDRPSHRDSMLFDKNMLNSLDLTKDTDEEVDLIRALAAQRGQAENPANGLGLGQGKYDSTLAQDVQLFGRTIEAAMRSHWYIRPAVLVLEQQQQQQQAQTAASSSSVNGDAEAMSAGLGLTPLSPRHIPRQGSVVTIASSANGSDERPHSGADFTNGLPTVPEALPADETTRRVLRKSKSMKLKSRPVTIHLAPSIHPSWSPLYSGNTSIVHHPTSPSEQPPKVPAVSPTWVSAHLRGDGTPKSPPPPGSATMPRSQSTSAVQFNGHHQSVDLLPGAPTRTRSTSEIQTKPPVLKSLPELPDTDAATPASESERGSVVAAAAASMPDIRNSTASISGHLYHRDSTASSLSSPSASKPLLSLLQDLPPTSAPDAPAAGAGETQVDDKDHVMRSVTHVLQTLVERMVQPDEEKRPVMREVLSWL